MERLNKLILQEVEMIPQNPEHGLIYYSERFNTAVHLCACGCGGKTVTPIFPGMFELLQLDPITIRPSIGNWSGETPYHAHYYITEGRIEWLK